MSKPQGVTNGYLESGGDLLSRPIATFGKLADFEKFHFVGSFRGFGPVEVTSAHVNPYWAHCTSLGLTSGGCFEGP